MTKYTYNTANLSVKDRLTISNLLGLFHSRLTANWAPADQTGEKPAHLELIDVDQPEGLRKWDGASPQGTARIAVTADDRSARDPFISRPIRAYGANGVIVLFNSIAQSLSLPTRESAVDRQREPARMRMMGRLESPAPPVRTAPPHHSQRPAAPRAVASTAPPPAQAPAAARVAVRWGPPEPVTLPPLVHMPGARIHWRPADQPKAPEIARPAVPIAAAPVLSPTQASPRKFWSAPGADALPPLIDMPTTHRPVEIHAPIVPLIRRVNPEKPAAAEARAAQPAGDMPTLRPSPPQWKAPEPPEIKTLIDFRSLPEFEPEPVQNLPAPAIDEPSEAAAAPTDNGASASTEAPEQELQTLFAELEPSLENLALALSDEASLAGEDLGGQDLGDNDAEVDWWGTADLEEDGAGSRPADGSNGLLLIHALKAIKASAQPSILEIPGLPAVCVIPIRNVYFTAAPAARLEGAMSARPEVTWRACSSEEEARRLSGTQQSRQASLEQLSWTASLASGPTDQESIVDHAVRLRRWPPITESRGRSKFIRYATMLSGAQATPRELSEITGDPLEEIVSFVNACSQMNLLETSAHAKTALAAAPIRSAGAGILRDMIEQLAPPKI